MWSQGRLIFEPQNGVLVGGCDRFGYALSDKVRTHVYTGAIQKLERHECAAV